MRFEHKYVIRKQEILLEVEIPPILFQFEGTVFGVTKSICVWAIRLPRNGCYTKYLILEEITFYCFKLYHLLHFVLLNFLTHLLHPKQ